MGVSEHARRPEPADVLAGRPSFAAARDAAYSVMASLPPARLSPGGPRCIGRLCLRRPVVMIPAARPPSSRATSAYQHGSTAWRGGRGDIV